MDIVFVIIAMMLASVLMGSLLYVFHNYLLKPLFSGLTNSVKYFADTLLNIESRKEKYGSKVFNFSALDSEANAIAKILEEAKGYKQRYSLPNLSYDKFMRLLQKHNISYKYMVQSCDINNTQCNGVMSLTFNNGVTFVLEFHQNNENRLKDNKGRVNFSFRNNEDNLQDYCIVKEDGQPKFRMLYGMKLYYPQHITNHSVPYKTFMEIINNCELGRVINDELNTIKRSTKVFKLKKGFGGEMDLGISYSISPTMSEEVFNNSYSNFVFEYDGHKVTCSPNQMIQIIAQLGMKGASCFFHGTFGTGKTVLQSHIAAELTNMDLSEEFDILQINANDIINVSCMDLQELLDNYFGANYETNRKLFVLIDEVESIAIVRDKTGIHSDASTILLGLTDGTLSKKYNSTVIATSNATADKLDPALFRKGRFEIQLAINPLEEEKARRLAAILSQSTTHTFNMSTFETLLNKVTKSGNEIVAKEGTITLADIYHCYMPIDLDTSIRTILGIAVPKVEVPGVEEIVKVPTPVAAPVIIPPTRVNNATDNGKMSMEAFVTKAEPHSNKRRGKKRR